MAREEMFRRRGRALDDPDLRIGHLYGQFVQLAHACTHRIPPTASAGARNPNSTRSGNKRDVVRVQGWFSICRPGRERKIR